MKNAYALAKIMARLDARAEKINPKCKIRIRRLIRQYMSTERKLAKALQQIMRASAYQAERDKMLADIVAWAETNYKNKIGRQTQNTVSRGKRRFLAGKTVSYKY